MHRLPILTSVLVISLLALVACESAPTLALHTQSQSSAVSVGAGDAKPWDAPQLERAIAIRDGRTNAPVSFAAMLDDLAEADVVFLGETHIDETTHRVEDAVYAGLLERRDGNVVLAMEMFERDVQPALDSYLAGEIDEAEFLAQSRPWSNYRTGYRRLIERAKKAGRPVVASNFPGPMRMKIAMGGRVAFDSLEGEEREQVPAELFPNTDAYWRRVDNAIRGHAAMMRGMGGESDRLTSTQSLWDNSMGESCALALDANAGSSVLHVNGGFHSYYWDGTVHQLKLRKPKAAIKTVSIQTSWHPAIADAAGAPVADYVVFAESRATDLNDGMWTVGVQRDLRYKMHLPPAAASGQAVPLLIWLGDDGLGSDDGLDLWKTRLGDDVAIAVIEPPFREVQPDLSPGGRWFWADTFAGDIGAMVEGVQRVWGYVLRNYPIDAERVVVAGEGTGATVAAIVALMTGRMDLEAIAVSPRQYVKVKDFPLPLPELRGDVPPRDKRLQVVVREADRSWWTDELAEYAAIGLDCAAVDVPNDPWQAEASAEATLRDVLGLPPATKASGERRHIVMMSDSQRARHWARLLALRITRDTGAPVAVLDAPPADDAASRPVSIDVTPEAFGDALPKCPGPFGGTTVLVMLEDTPADHVEQWLALEENDPLKSRFHRLRVATVDGERRLPALLESLEAAKRTNVLIIPAAFCADVETMRALERSVSDLADRMTIQWLPGLGGRDVTPGL